MFDRLTWSQVAECYFPIKQTARQLSVEIRRYMGTIVMLLLVLMLMLMMMMMMKLMLIMAVMLK